MKGFIGLIGAKRAGKDTACEAIKTVFPKAVTITLAGPLKDCCSEVLGIPREAFDKDDLKEKELDDLVELNWNLLDALFNWYSLKYQYDAHARPHIGKVLRTPRQVAQYVGTEVLRTVDPDIHCKTAFAGKTGDFGIITDLRFPNEDSFFQKLGKPYMLVYVANLAAETEAAKDTHVSEAYLQTLVKKANFTVPNNDSLQAFQGRVKRLTEDQLAKGLGL